MNIQNIRKLLFLSVGSIIIPSLHGPVYSYSSDAKPDNKPDNKPDKKVLFDGKSLEDILSHDGFITKRSVGSIIPSLHGRVYSYSSDAKPDNKLDKKVLFDGKSLDDITTREYQIGHWTIDTMGSMNKLLYERPHKVPIEWIGKINSLINMMPDADSHVIYSIIRHDPFIKNNDIRLRLYKIEVIKKNNQLEIIGKLKLYCQNMPYLEQCENIRKFLTTFQICKSRYVTAEETGFINKRLRDYLLEDKA